MATDFYDNQADASYGRAAAASGTGSSLTASWAPANTGFRYLVGCVYSDAGARSCAMANVSTPIVSAARGIAITLTGPGSAAAGAQTSYSATLTVGGSASVQRVGLFDAETGEILAERTAAPYDFSLTMPLSRKLVAVALSSSGDQFASNAITVISSNQAPSIAISRPVTGSEFAAGTTIPILVSGADADGSVNRVELWQVGDTGTDTLLGSANAATLTQSLTLPPYTQTLRLYAYVVDNQGARIKSVITTITSRADITDPRYFVWTNFSAALKAGNKAAALEFLTPTAQANYGDLLDELMPQMTSVATSLLPVFVLIELSAGTADYLIARNIGGQRLVFGLRFVMSEDGRWKLETM